jgi:transposase
VPAPASARTVAQKKSLIASERDETARAAWRQTIAAVDPTTLVFLDETSTQTVLTRTHARAPRGQRIVARLPRNHGENVTCLAAVTPAGITAPLVFEGALDGPIFAQWVGERLLPALRPGQTIVLDNLSVHKNAAARAAIEAAGCTLCFLPAYSPDFNPIELVFAQLKASLRNAAARTFHALVDAIGAAFDHLSPADIHACFRHCGYDLTAAGQAP